VYIASGILFRRTLVCVYFAQDGFFDGELMDGRRGLVPSNFIQKVPGTCTLNSVFFEDHCNVFFHLSSANKRRSAY